MYRIRVDKEGFGRSDNTRQPVFVERKDCETFEEAKEAVKEFEKKYFEELKNGNYERTIFDIEVTNDEEEGILYRIRVELKDGVIKSTEYNKVEGEYSDEELDLGKNFEKTVIRTATKDSRKPRKYNVGDSVKFKSGKVGVVEDYDDNYYYVKDANCNVVKIKKVKDGINMFTNEGNIDGIIENTSAEKMFDKARDTQEIGLYLSKDRKYLALIQVEGYYMGDTEGWDYDEEDGYEVSFTITKATEKLDLKNVEAVDSSLTYETKETAPEQQVIEGINKVLQNFKNFNE